MPCSLSTPLPSQDPWMIYYTKNYGMLVLDLWLRCPVRKTGSFTFLKAIWNSLKHQYIKGVDQQMPSFNLPAKILCKVVHVQL